MQGFGYKARPFTRHASRCRRGAVRPRGAPDSDITLLVTVGRLRIWDHDRSRFGPGEKARPLTVSAQGEPLAPHCVAFVAR